MQLTDEDLIEMMTQIWDTMIGEALSTDDIAEGQTFGMHSSVDIESPDGSTVAVVIECGAALASRLAEVLFSMPADEVADEDAADAVGELANIFGGNVKGVLALSATLTLPKVVVGSMEPEAYPGAILNRVGFDAGGHRLVASLRDRQLVS